jgi:carboxylesterase
MNRTTWNDWYGEVDDAFRGLAATHEKIVVAGLSMGGALALRLAEVHGDRVAGVVLVNGAVKVEDPRLLILPLLKYVVPSLPGISNDIAKPGMTELGYDKTPLKALHSQVTAWGTVVAELKNVRCPALVFNSRNDHVVPASSTALILETIGSTDVTHVVLEQSYHVATLDHDAPLIEQMSIDFIRRITS